MSDSVNLTYTVRVHDEGPDGLWAEVDELPGLFASGQSEEELNEALEEAIGMYLSTPDSHVAVERVHRTTVVEQVDEYHLVQC